LLDQVALIDIPNSFLSDWQWALFIITDFLDVLWR